MKIYKNEKQLQAAMVIEFSQKHPEKYGQLWSVQNRTFSIKDGNTQKAMGLHAGVADLHFFEDQLLTAFEVKLSGAEHSRKHIMKQYEWGRRISDQGGIYYIVTSVEALMYLVGTRFVKGEWPGIYSLPQVRKMLFTGSKTLVFK